MLDDATPNAISHMVSKRRGGMASQAYSLLGLMPITADLSGRADNEV